MRPDRRYLKNGWVTLYTSFQAEWARARGIKRLRINGATFEKVVLASIHELLNDRSRLRAIMIENGHRSLDLAAEGAKRSRLLEGLSHPELRSALHGLIERIEVSRERIIVQLRPVDLVRLLAWEGAGFFRRDPLRAHARLFILDVPCLGVARLERKLRLPISSVGIAGRPDSRLVALVREMRAAQALSEEHGGATDGELASKLNRSTGFFMRLLRLNYLAPDIVAAILEGTQPTALKRKHLLNADLPLDWALQRKLFGFPEQPPLQTSERY